MSRRTLIPRLPGTSVVCGWDNPLQTYFATVTRQPERDDDNVILWVGTSRREILRPEDLARHLKPYTQVDEATMAALRRDRAEATAPTPLQRFGGSFGR